MDNPFKKILRNEKLPKVIKSKVLKDIGMIKLSIDMADLFVLKYPSVVTDLLSVTMLEKNNKNKIKQ